jgi:hypothetical protein
MRRQMTDDRGQVTVETTFNQKLLRGELKNEGWKGGR